MNWYENLTWPKSVDEWPNAPNMTVQVPYGDGAYPWVTSGTTEKMSNGDVWTVYIRSSTPNGYQAGTAVSKHDGGDTLNCWAYRGRPVSSAINQTVNAHAICWSAFVCNHDSHAPPLVNGMGSKTSTLQTSSAPPETSFVSATRPSGATATPTGTAQGRSLLVQASVNPRFVTWKHSWAQFIKDLVWDRRTGKCLGAPIQGDGYTIVVDCDGVQLGPNTQMTLQLIEALQNVGIQSQWFSQSPPVPSISGKFPNATSWVIMPEAFSLQATDTAKKQVIGYFKYTTKYNGFISGPCQTCDTARFNKQFFDPIIAAMEGTYPDYTSFEVQADCNPWMVC